MSRQPTATMEEKDIGERRADEVVQFLLDCACELACVCVPM